MHGEVPAPIAISSGVAGTGTLGPFARNFICSDLCSTNEALSESTVHREV